MGFAGAKVDMTVQRLKWYQQMVTHPEHNDAQLRGDVAESAQGVWGFLGANNVVIMNLFHGAGAAAAKSAKLVEEQMHGSQFLQPLGVASGLGG